VPTELDVVAFDPKFYIRFSNVEVSYPAEIPPIALPFGGNAFGETTLSDVEIMSYIPSSTVSKILIQCYLDAVEGTHRLFHLPTLYQELHDFWSDQHGVEYDWLAQLFMMLALGYRASDDKMQLGLLGSRTASPSRMDKCIFAARTSLEKSSYMHTAKKHGHQSHVSHGHCHSDEWLFLQQFWCLWSLAKHRSSPCKTLGHHEASSERDIESLSL
jgi:hypothetical protein